jgi:hypothetical protein
MNDIEGQNLFKSLIIQLPTTGLHSELVQYCPHIFTIRASDIFFTLGRLTEIDGGHNHMFVKHCEIGLTDLK